MFKHDALRATVLDGVRVASPCSADWDAMKGDDRVRFCGSCAKNVYNLSGMPRAEAEELLRKHEADDLCIRLFRRADGTVISDDCPVGVRTKRVRRVALAVLATTGFAGAAIVAAGTMTMGARARPEPEPSLATEACAAPAPDPQIEPPAQAVEPAASTNPAPASASSPPGDTHLMGRRRR